MANRSYLYSTNLIPTGGGDAGLATKGLSESGGNFVLPLSFLLLVSGKTKTCQSAVFAIGHKSALIGDYQLGISNLQKFIEFLLQHNAHNADILRSQASEALAFLRDKKNTQRYILLEIAELFMMNPKENDVLSLKKSAEVVIQAMTRGDITAINNIAGGDILTDWETLLSINDWSDALYYSSDDAAAKDNRNNMDEEDESERLNLDDLQDEDAGEVEPLPLNKILNPMHEAKMAEFLLDLALKNKDYIKALEVSLHILKHLDQTSHTALKGFLEANEALSTTRMLHPDPWVSIAVKTYPDEAWAHEANAMYLFRLGGEHYIQAKREFEKSIELNQSNSHNFRMMGEIYLINREADKAANYLRSASEMAPENKEYLTRYALALVRKGKVDEALTLADKAITKGELDKDSLDNIGMVLLLVGKLHEAHSYFKRAYELLPSYGYFQKHVEWAQREIADFNARKAQGKRYTPLYVRQQDRPKLHFDEDTRQN